MKPKDNEYPYPVLYRYADGGGPKPYVWLEEYSIIRETPKGYWLQVHKPKLKFVLKSGFKRFAHPTLEQAKFAFIKRKQRQRRHLIEQLHHVTYILGMEDCFSGTNLCNPFDLLGS